MTNTDKIIMVKAMTDESDDSVISAFLAMAAEAICHYADPHKTRSQDEVIANYGGPQCRIAANWLNKRGADGQLAHDENGIMRTYESGDIPVSILREITPIAGVIS